MTYIVLRLFGELFILIGEGNNEYKIADWASARYYEWNDYGVEIEVFLEEVNLMNEPGFELSISEIFKRGFDILQSEFNKEPNLNGEVGMYDELNIKYKHYFDTKRDAKYPVFSVCGKIFLLIANETSADRFAKWAFDEYQRIKKHNCNVGILQFLSDLAVMDTPGFEIEVSEIIKRSIGILQLELNAICKMYNEYQPS